MNKQVYARILAVGMVATMMISTASATVTDSVESKAAPEVLTTVSELTGEEVIAIAYDANGVEVDSALVEQVLITPIAQADSASAEIAQPLVEAYEEIVTASSLAEINPSIIEVAQQVMPEVPVENLVVRDLFDVYLPEEMESYILAGEGTVAMTFDLGVTADQAVIVMVQCSGDTWTTVSASNVSNNANGSVSVNFDQFCPVAFVVEQTDVEPVVTAMAVSGEVMTSPQTGAPHAMADYALFAVLFGFGAVALTGASVKARKSK